MTTAINTALEELTTPAKACHCPDTLRHIASTVLSNKIAESITVAPLPPENVRLSKNIELYVERYCRCDDEDFDDHDCDYVKPRFKKEFRSPYPKNTSLIYHFYDQNRIVDSLPFCTAVPHCDYCDGAIIDKEAIQDIREEATLRYYEKHNILNPRQIRSIRKELGFSIPAFASMLGLSQGQLQTREQGITMYDRAFSEKVADVVRNWGNWGSNRGGEVGETGESGEACN